MSEFHSSQPKRIAHHQYRAKTHRGRRDYGAQQNAEKWIKNARSDWNAERIIDKSEKEILSDIPHAQPA